MRKRTIHFEQIPVALVKKIAEADVPKNQDTGCDNRIAKVPARGMNPYGVRDVHLEERALDMEDSSGNDDLKYPGWQKPLLEAVLELDAHKSKARVAAAEITICNRLETLSPGHDHHAERQALDDALRTLRILKT